MNLDKDRMEWNTPEARAARTNAPAWCDGLLFGTYPRLGPELKAVAEWASRAETNLVLYGKAGLGKTGLGVCALRRLAARGFGSAFQWNIVTSPEVVAAVLSGEDERLLAPCWFERFSRLLTMNRRPEWDAADWFQQLEESVACLMLDDVGTDTGTQFRESFLLQHLDWALDFDRRVVVTMNLPLERWAAVLGEPTADRLLSSDFTKVEFSGESLR